MAGKEDARIVRFLATEAVGYCLCQIPLACRVDGQAEYSSRPLPIRVQSELDTLVESSSQDVELANSSQLSKKLTQSPKIQSDVNGRREWPDKVGLNLEGADVHGAADNAWEAAAAPVGDKVGCDDLDFVGGQDRVVAGVDGRATAKQSVGFRWTAVILQWAEFWIRETPRECYNKPNPRPGLR